MLSTSLQSESLLNHSCSTYGNEKTDSFSSSSSFSRRIDFSDEENQSRLSLDRERITFSFKNFQPRSPSRARLKEEEGEESRKKKVRIRKGSGEADRDWPGTSSRKRACLVSQFSAARAFPFICIIQLVS